MSETIEFENDVTVLRENELGLSISTKLPLFKGGYTLQGIGTSSEFRDGSGGSGTLNYSIPDTSTLVRAILYWNKFSTVDPESDILLNGSTLTGDLVGKSGDTCWTFVQAKNKVFRKDITSLVTQKTGSLLISGLPDINRFGLTDSSQGAALLLIYSDPNEELTKIDVYDGCVVLNSTGFSVTPGVADPNSKEYGITLAGEKARRIGFGVGDGQPFSTDDFRLSGVTIPDSQPNGRDGFFMDAYSTDVRGLNAEPPLILETTFIDDCLSWFLVVHDTGSAEPPPPSPTGFVCTCPDWGKATSYNQTLFSSSVRLRQWVESGAGAKRDCKHIMAAKRIMGIDQPIYTDPPYSAPPPPATPG
jgi:hypothetical protein